MFSQKWKSLLDKIDDFTRSYDGTAWFRGHNNSTYKLNSGLFRLNPDNKSLEKYLTLEKQLYTYYKNLGYLIHNNEAGWNLLYSMQHHGVKTRLLDWTESMSVALFFALDGWTNGTAKIWVLKPTELNRLSLGKNEILSPQAIEYPKHFEDPNQKSIAIYPIKSNKRIVAQNGVFTVQGNSMLPLEEEFEGNLITNNIIKAFELTLDIKEDAVRFLYHNGINRFTLFPDLEGLSNHINNTLIPPAWR
ncbi:FRG domain-containing protein [Thermicanus aegyptius]|uniref:FRG domain-containing protein n=1 Tax=Thermicanus aegyptius TaxID=94009 RepID=UPI0004197ADE|nr:FRG domain-containing protein [Thermicanus aegyptius]